MGKLDGKVAVITGAASGMGRATAIRFAKEGAAVVVADLNSQGGEMVISEIAAAKGRAVYQRTDVTSETDIKSVIDRAVKEYGRLDITYNNAGVGGAMGKIEVDQIRRLGQDLPHSHPRGLPRNQVFDRADAQSWWRIDHLDLVGGGTARRRGTSCVQRGESGRHQHHGVGSDRVGSRSYPRELHLPGGIVTPLTVRGVPGGEEAAAKNMARMQPIPRAGKPEDIAAMALFLASDDSEWITGTSMIVDGGMATGNTRIRMPQLGSGFSGPSFERQSRD